MSQPYDAVTKSLLTLQPKDWLDFLGLPAHEVHVIDADLATITADADKVLAVQSPTPFLLHLEFQSGYDPLLPERLLHYHVLLRYRHKRPVHTVVLLLRKAADHSLLTGAVDWEGPQGKTTLSFAYQVVRVWELPVEAVLGGGVGVLPLAPISAVSEEELAGVVSRMRERIREEVETKTERLMWTAVWTLMGLRYSEALTERLLEGVLQDMRESVTYQAILREGEQKGRVEGRAEGQQAEAQHILLLIGGKRFGEPDQATRDALSLLSVEAIEALIKRALDVESWQELLAGSAT